MRTFELKAALERLEKALGDGAIPQDEGAGPGEEKEEGPAPEVSAGGLTDLGGGPVALLADDGTVGDSDTLTHESIIGTVFEGRVVEHVVESGRPAVITEIAGMAFPTGEHAFVLDERDPVGRGFVLR